MTTEKENEYAIAVYGIEFEKLNKMEKHRVSTIIKNCIKEKFSSEVKW